MTHDEIAKHYGIKPGDHCASCGVPVTVDEITRGDAETVHGEPYHYDCVDPIESAEAGREDSAQIALDHARRTEGW